MQTMPSKNRTSVAVTGIALLVLVIGLIVYGVNQRTKQEVGELDPMTQLAEPENGIAMEPAPVENAAATAPDAGSAAIADPVTDATAMTAPETNAEAAGQETAPALIMMGSVPETHLVQPGETLYSISMNYYNDKIYAGDIEELNGLADPNQIQAGMELKLPRPENLTAVGE